jgi:hypothetical protein
MNAKYMHRQFDGEREREREREKQRDRGRKSEQTQGPGKVSAMYRQEQDLRAQDEAENHGFQTRVRMWANMRLHESNAQQVEIEAYTSRIRMFSLTYVSACKYECCPCQGDLSLNFARAFHHISSSG